MGSRPSGAVERPPQPIPSAARPWGELREPGTPGCVKFDVLKPGDGVPVDVGWIAPAARLQFLDEGACLTAQPVKPASQMSDAQRRQSQHVMSGGQAAAEAETPCLDVLAVVAPQREPHEPVRRLLLEPAGGV